MHTLPPFVVWPLNAAIVLVVLLVTSHNRRAQAVISFAALVDVGSWLLNHTVSSQVTTIVDLVSRMLFLGALTAALCHTVFHDDDYGTYHRIEGGVAIYLNVGLLFALVYRLALQLDPHAFTIGGASNAEPMGQSVYFSFVTLTTTGYGDVAPIEPLVRSIANLESVIGTLFPATLLARLVIRYLG